MPSGGLICPDRIASCAAANVGELVSPPDKSPAEVPGVRDSNFVAITAIVKPVAAMTTAREKYLSPSYLNTSKNLGPA